MAHSCSKVSPTTFSQISQPFPLVCKRPRLGGWRNVRGAMSQYKKMVHCMVRRRVDAITLRLTSVLISNYQERISNEHPPKRYEVCNHSGAAVSGPHKPRNSSDAKLTFDHR